MFDKILSTPTAQVGRVGRFMIFQLKLWIHCFRLLRKNRSDQQAAALSYYTMFGIVPLAVVMVMVFQFFPAYKDAGLKIKDYVYTQLHLATIEYPDPANPNTNIKLTDNLDAIVAKVFAEFNQGTIAVLGATLIIVAALMMLLTIEAAFDQIWGVGISRSIVTRISHYWLLLTGGPILVATAIFMVTKYFAISQLQETLLSHTAPFVISYLASAAVFFLLYFFLPNTKVKVRAAIWGAVIAAIVWTLAKWGFKLYVVKFIPYNQIYGALGLIPLGVFWIYLSWLIVLFGLQLTYTTQHLSTLDAAEIAAARKQEEYFIANDLTIMNMVGEIASAFKSGDGAVEAETISGKLNIPPEFAEKVLSHLVAGGILVRVSEPKEGFLPAKSPDDMKLSEIAAAIAVAGFGQSPDAPTGLRKIAQSQQEMFSHFNVSQLIRNEDNPPG
jgi:membrane protein